MTSVLLSQHSSNPLELPSSDPSRQEYLNRVKKVTGSLDSRNDSDAVREFYKPEMQDYQNHLGKLFPRLKKQAKVRVAPVVEEIESDEALFAIPKHYREKYENTEEEEDEEEDEDEEDENADADLDAHGETDEEMTIQLKSPEEREEIEEEIQELEEAVPKLAADYKIVDRLGTGTFSSVYKAIDLHYHKWNNTPWHGSHPPSSSAHYQSSRHPSGSKVFVAIKKIYPTSNPERIRNEISIMQDARGCRHVSQLITAFRHEDQVVAIMPYHRNEDFRNFYRVLPMAGIKAYFRCMFRALRDIHARGMIHRDVKPANFLFDPRTGVGTLCDFGLACRMEPGPKLGACLHTHATREYPHGRIRPKADYDIDHIKRMQKEARQKSLLPSEKVGYPDKDTRPQSKANRAGTRGFRSPEVLLKCGEQNGSVDVWSAGMILLFFLVGKFPMFQSNDDVEALMEIATIIGRRRMEKAATLHGRTFATNLPDITPDGISWRAFVEKQNPNLHIPPEPDMRVYPYSVHSSTTTESPHPLPPSSSSRGASRSVSRSPSPNYPISPSGASPTTESHAADLESAFDFLEQVMQPESTRRITPRGALYHPFLATEPEDDEFFPHPFGEGVCGAWHFVDEVTEEPCVNVNVGGDKHEVRRLDAGEGIAIGRQPCELHRGDFGC